MVNCFLCSIKSELDEHYYGYHLNGWIALKVSSIVDETICWHTINVCDQCSLKLDLILNKLKENVKSNIQNPPIL